MAEMLCSGQAAFTSSSGSAFGGRKLIARRATARVAARQQMGVAAAAGHEQDPKPSDTTKSYDALEARIASGEFTDAGSTKERLTRPLRRLLAKDPLGPGGQRRQRRCGGSHSPSAFMFSIVNCWLLSWAGKDPQAPSPPATGVLLPHRRTCSARRLPRTCAPSSPACPASYRPQPRPAPPPAALPSRPCRPRAVLAAGQDWQGVAARRGGAHAHRHGRHPRDCGAARVCAPLQAVPDLRQDLHALLWPQAVCHRVRPTDGQAREQAGAALVGLSAGLRRQRWCWHAGGSCRGLVSVPEQGSGRVTGPCHRCTCHRWQQPALLSSAGAAM